MLILTRRIGEKIIIGGNIFVEVLGVFPGHVVRLGITAPKAVRIDRLEIHELGITEGWRSANPCDVSVYRGDGNK